MRYVKTKNQISVQLERIHRLYCHGYGTTAMLEKCEMIYFKLKIEY